MFNPNNQNLTYFDKAQQTPNDNMYSQEGLYGGITEWFVSGKWMHNKISEKG